LAVEVVVTCGCKRYAYLHHTGSLETLRERGFLKSKVFKENYAHKLDFEEGWGLKPKKRSVRGVWIFSGETELTSLIDSSKF